MLKNKTLYCIVLAGLLVGCQKTEPPSDRPAVTLPVYTAGDANKGKLLYADECGQCHQLQIGNNRKAPQLLKIYGAKAGILTDYQYSDTLKNSQIIWTAENIDRYIANPKQNIPNTKMKTDPITDEQVRKDIIAYLSTLR